MSREQVSGSAVDGGRQPGEKREWVLSTSCLVAVFVVLIVVLIVAPALLWSAGIACG